VKESEILTYRKKIKTEEESKSILFKFNEWDVEMMIWTNKIRWITNIYISNDNLTGEEVTSFVTNNNLFRNGITFVESGEGRIIGTDYMALHDTPVLYTGEIIGYIGSGLTGAIRSDMNKIAEACLK
jgi:hypothetical protein